MRSIRFGAHLGRGAGRLAVDTALRGRRAFPRTVGDLTPANLSEITGRRITDINVLDAAPGTSTHARLGLTGDDMPDSVFIKMSAGSAAIRMLGELAGLGETEAQFYRHLAPDLGDRALPRSYGAGFDALTGRYVVVLEDMTVSPCQFPDTLHPLDKDQMGQLIECFAHLHATFWGKPPETPGGTGKFGWLMAPSTDPSNPITPSVMKMSARKLAGRTAVGEGRFIWENFQSITEVIDSGPHTVLHGDAHPGNTFFRNGQAGLLDWQVVRRGHPARDLAYTMVLGMPTDDRRAVQEDLLATYLSALAARGGPELDREEFFTRFRQAVIHPYISALSTAALGGMQADDVALEGLRRAVAALEDLDPVGALRPVIA
ncbi:MAG TPA: phosphotransferase [Mycobacterium sp.]|nr:phosphotransferase [Mycobacterium sp.]